MAGSLTVGGMKAGLLTGEEIIGPLSIVGGSVIGQTVDVPLASGDNTIAVPAGSVAALIVIPSTNAAELKLRTNLNSTDGGTPFGPTGYVVWPLYLGTTSLIINAASATGTIEVSYI